MTKQMIKERTMDEASSVELFEATEESTFFATSWLLILGLVLGATLLCSAVLMAWPIVAQFAAKLQ